MCEEARKTVILERIAKETGIPIFHMRPSMSSMSDYLGFITSNKPHSEPPMMLHQHLNILMDCAEDDLKVFANRATPWGKEVLTAIEAVRRAMREGAI